MCFLKGFYLSLIVINKIFTTCPSVGERESLYYVNCMRQIKIPFDPLSSLINDECKNPIYFHWHAFSNILSANFAQELT